MSRSSALALALTCALSPIALGADDVPQLKARIQLLESQLKAAEARVARLQEENERLRSGASAEEKAERVDPFAEGSRWKGTATITMGGVSHGSAIVTIVERDERTAKLAVTFESGAKWTFDCKTSGHSLKISGATRERAADRNLGKRDLGDVGATHGSGSVSHDKLTIGYTVPNMLEGKISANREK